MKLQHTLALLLILSFCSQPKEESAPVFQQLSNPAKNNASLPYLINGADGNLYLSWVEKGDSNQVEFKFSQLENDSWTLPEIIAHGDNWFVNWADYPMMAVDNSGNKMAHYLAKSASGTYAYDVNLVIKKKDTSSWSRAIVPHLDGTPTEHGFVTMLPNNNTSFTIAWLDGRNTGGGDHGHGSGAMTFRSAVVNVDGSISEAVELDGRVCDCCQTSGGITPDGPMFVYRDRSVDEVRDMAFVSKKDSVWQEPKLVAQDNWNIAGCPVNGPRMSTKGNVAVVAWYTAALNRPTVKIAFKAGETFDEAIIIDSTSPVGRVDVALINETTAAVSWLDGGEKPAIKYRMINEDGSMSPVYVVTETSEERGSGFPQMEAYNGHLYFAWTKMGETNELQLKKVALN